MGYTDNVSDAAELDDILGKQPLRPISQPEWVGQDAEEGLRLGTGFVPLEGPLGKDPM